MKERPGWNDASATTLNQRKLISGWGTWWFLLRNRYLGPVTLVAIEWKSESPTRASASRECKSFSFGSTELNSLSHRCQSHRDRPCSTLVWTIKDTFPSGSLTARRDTESKHCENVKVGPGGDAAMCCAYNECTHKVVNHFDNCLWAKSNESLGDGARGKHIHLGYGKRKGLSQVRGKCKFIKALKTPTTM